jgi:hypothetical protein
MQDRTNEGGTIVGLSFWITAAAMAVWMLLWFLTGNFLSSVLSIVGALTFLAIWSSEKSFFPRTGKALSTGAPAPLEG